MKNVFDVVKLLAIKGTTLSRSTIASSFFFQGMKLYNFKNTIDIVSIIGDSYILYNT